MRSGLLAALPLLVACSPSGLEQVGEQAEEVRIDAVEPSWGPPEGGTRVTISGAGFVGDVTVAFGYAEVEATVLDEEHVEAVTPAANVEVTVDVTVTSELGSAALPGGFTYTDEPPPEDTGSGDEPGATGQVGGLLQLYLLQIACPACLGLTTDLDVEALAAFHEPADEHWTDWFPQPGSCVRDPVITNVSDRFLDLGEWVYLQAGSVSISMRRQVDADGTSYLAADLGNEDFLRSSLYDLSVPDGGDWGPFELVDALETPEGFSSIEPVELLYTDPRSAFAPVVSRSRGLSLSWAPSGSSGTVMVQVAAYSSDGSRYLGMLACRASDTGSLQVPSSQLAGWPSRSLLLVYVNRYVLGNPLLPPTGDSLDAVASIGAVGTASLVD